MKLFTIAATFIFCFNFQAFTQEFVIKGKIINPVKQSIEFAIPTLFGQYEYVEIKLDSLNNTFEYRHKLDGIAYINISHNSFNENKCLECTLREVVIEPSDEVSITFDTEDFWNSLQFEGKSAEKFNYIKEDYVETKIKQDWEQQLKQHATDSTNKYFAYIDQTLENKVAILKKYEGKLSPMFYKITDADLKAMVGNLRMRALYDTTLQDFKPIQALPYELQKAFFNNLPAQNDTTVKAKHFFAYVTSLHYIYLSEFHTFTRSAEAQRKVSVVRQNQVYFHPAFAEKLSGEVLLRKINEHGLTPVYKENFAEFKALYPNSPLLQKIEGLLDTKKDFVIGKSAMPFKVLDLNGKEVSLEDFQGKVVYLDFWSSSCVPCIADIASSKNIKEHFKDRNDIVFLYISLDTNESKWKAAIDKYNIKGINTIAYDTNPILDDYKISGIPSYFVIGKDGNFHTIAPPRPTINAGKSLIKVLEKALAANTNE